MARLKHLQSGRLVTLGAATVIGRSKACAVITEHPKTSGRHAVFRHERGQWYLRDLGSRNGTLVDGDALPCGGQARLAVGSHIELGGDRWVFVDDGPPVVTARGDDGLSHAAVDGLLGLPEDAPEVMIYRHRGQWVAEHDGLVQPVLDGELIIVGDREWWLELPPPTAGGGTHGTADPTGDLRCLAALSRLTLAVSRDEETVRITLDFGGESVQLPVRSFGYLLVILARARARDADELEAEQGWEYAEDVCREMGIAATRLNVEVYRCRKMLTGAGLEDGSAIIERRPHTRQLRLGVGCAEVVALS